MDTQENQTETPPRSAPDVDEKSRREMSVKLVRVDKQIGIDQKTNEPIFQEPLTGISVSRGDRYDHIHFDHEQQEIYLDVDAAKVAVEQSNGTLVVAKDSRINLKGETVAAPDVAEEPPTPQEPGAPPAATATARKARVSKQNGGAPPVQS